MTYNHERYIRQALDSFLMQEFDQPFEIIVADDKSSDRTPEIIQEYQDLYPDKIKFLPNEENMGSLKNGKRAIGQAQGQFYSMCDGDDFFLTKDKLQKSWEYMKKNPEVAMLFSPALSISDKTGKRFIRNEYANKEIRSIDLNWVLRRGGGFFPTCTSFYKASVYSEWPSWFFKHSAGDYAWATLAALKGKIGYIPEVTACYRVHDQSHSNKKFDCKGDCVADIQRKRKMNLSFYAEIRKTELVSNRTIRQLERKEEYIYFSKEINCGVGLMALRGVLFGDMSIYYRIRLVAKFIKHCLSKL